MWPAPYAATVLLKSVWSAFKTGVKSVVLTSYCRSAMTCPPRAVNLADIADDKGVAVGVVALNYDDAFGSVVDDHPRVGERLLLIVRDGPEEIVVGDGESGRG